MKPSEKPRYDVITRLAANQRMKLTGAAILVSRGVKVLQAAPAAYPYRYAANEGHLNRELIPQLEPLVERISEWKGQLVEVVEQITRSPGTLDRHFTTWSAPQKLVQMLC